MDGIGWKSARSTTVSDPGTKLFFRTRFAGSSSSFASLSYICFICQSFFDSLNILCSLRPQILYFKIFNLFLYRFYTAKEPIFSVVKASHTAYLWFYKSFWGNCFWYWIQENSSWSTVLLRSPIHSQFSIWYPVFVEIQCMVGFVGNSRVTCQQC